MPFSGVVPDEIIAFAGQETLSFDEGLAVASLKSDVDRMATIGNSVLILLQKQSRFGGGQKKPVAGPSSRELHGGVADLTLVGFERKWELRVSRFNVRLDISIQ